MFIENINEARPINISKIWPTLKKKTSIKINTNECKVKNKIKNLSG